MYPILWYIILLESIPEVLLIILLGFALFNLPISYNKALGASLITGLVTFMVRQLPIVFFGLHTLIGAMVLVVLCTWLTGHYVWKVGVAILAGLTICGLLQSIFLPLCFYFTNTNIQNMSANPWLNVLFFLPIFIIMSILYFVIRTSGYNLFDIEGKD